MENFLQTSGISQRDLALISNVVEEFRSNGIIEKRGFFEGLSEEEFGEVLREAIDASLTERELNPDYYDQDLDEALQSMSHVINDPSDGGFMKEL